MKSTLAGLWRMNLRLLTFRSTTEELQSLNYRHFWFGLFFTWLAGVGRTWDSPSVEPLRRSGIGSVVYVFILALILAAVIQPLSRPKVSYFQVLTFVVLTSPPALLYATPIELILPVQTAAIINQLFLLFVATWRVSLLVFFLRRGLLLTKPQTFAVTLLPLSAIMSVLAVFKVMYSIAEAMAGLHEESPANNVMLAITFYLGLFSMAAFLPLLGYYFHLKNQLETEEFITQRNRLLEEDSAQ